MSTPCVYDKARNGDYDFNTLDYYLTEEQVEAASKAVVAEDSDTVLPYIAETERLKRDWAKGLLSKEDFVRKCRDREDALLSELGAWAYQTEAYKQFYRALR